MLYLSSPELKDLPDNPCLPLLEHFHVLDLPREPWIIVAPLARDWGVPPMYLAIEALRFVRITLQVSNRNIMVLIHTLTHIQGLAFLHSHHIAHRYADYMMCYETSFAELLSRDLKAENIMMDPSQMFPNGINPLATSLLFNTQTVKEPAHKDRIDVDVRYVIIDYGLSTKFASFEDRKLVQFQNDLHSTLSHFFETNEQGEKSRTRWYDPFKADIATLGNEFQIFCADVSLVVSLCTTE